MGWGDDAAVLHRMRQFGKAHFRLSIEELKPVPGILSKCQTFKGTIRGITGDRVEVDTSERAPRYLSLEAGGDEARGCRLAGAVEIMVNDHDDIVGLPATCETPPTKVFSRISGKGVLIHQKNASRFASIRGAMWDSTRGLWRWINLRRWRSEKRLILRSIAPICSVDVGLSLGKPRDLGGRVFAACATTSRGRRVCHRRRRPHAAEDEDRRHSILSRAPFVAAGHRATEPQ